MIEKFQSSIFYMLYFPRRYALFFAFSFSWDAPFPTAPLVFPLFYKVKLRYQVVFQNYHECEVGTDYLRIFLVWCQFFGEKRGKTRQSGASQTLEQPICEPAWYCACKYWDYGRPSRGFDLGFVLQRRFCEKVSKTRFNASKLSKLEKQPWLRQ